MNKDFQTNNKNIKVAFLRGINVGGHALIKMEQLRNIFESLGFKNVKTVLASGNVIFETEEINISKITKHIELALKKKLDRDITVIVRSITYLKDLELKQPFKDIKVNPQTRLLTTFISGKIKSKHDIVELSHKDFVILDIYDGIICSSLQLRKGFGTPDFMSFIEKKFGKSVTTRTWNTILKILNTVDR